MLDTFAVIAWKIEHPYLKIHSQINPLIMKIRVHRHTQIQVEGGFLEKTVWKGHDQSTVFFTVQEMVYLRKRDSIEIQDR